MIDFLAAMFWSPEAQADPYTWGTVLLAHAAVGAVLAAMASLLTRRPVLLVSLVYALAWEGGQLALAGAGLADSLLTEAQRTIQFQEENGDPTVLVVPPLLRPSLARFLRPNFPQLGVLSNAELPEERRLRITAVIGGGAS